MAEASPPKPEGRRYRTTRPIVPPTPDRKVIESRVNDDLLIQLRCFEPTDLEHIHRLRTQEAVMLHTSQGAIDANIEASQKWMNKFIPPNDIANFSFTLWAKQGDNPWEHIGVMGYELSTPVPFIGYMIRSEWWGKSIAPTALKAILDVWWKLERKEVILNTADVKDEHESHLMNLEFNQPMLENDQDTNSDEAEKTVPEVLLAEVELNNARSRRVVERCGFQYRDRETIVHPTGIFTILDYTMLRPHDLQHATTHS